jgi:membrane protease YdiL (CAAX protease family)
MGLWESLNIWIGTGGAALFSLLLLQRLPAPPAIRKGDVTVSSTAAGLMVGFVMALMTWSLYPVSLDLVPALSREVPKLYALLREPPGPVWAFPILVLVVTAEEWVWRGLAIDLLSKSRSAGGAVVLSALIYVLPQIAFRSPLLVVVAFSCGLIWGALRVWTKGLFAPLLAHLLWDLLVFVMFPVE